MSAVDLGNLEVVTATKANPSRAAAHITELEKRVDALVEENRNLKRELTSKPSAVTQAMYDDICQKYQMEVAKNLPF